VDVLRGYVNQQSTAQKVLVRTFALIRRTGLLKSRLGQWAFETAYLAYKELLEAGYIDHLERLIAPGTLVLDIGANIGFFTTRFARWVGPQGRVVAIEPEASNFSRLRQRLARSPFLNRIQLIRAAACEISGTVMLETNPDHPGDHKLGPNGVPTPAVTIDEIVAGLGWPVISLIKIDVQGAEYRVVAGGQAAIKRFRPALFIEIDDAMLRRQGSNAASLIEMIRSLGYDLYRLERKGISRGPDETLARVTSGSGYADVLFLPNEMDPR
jgi:FkbM family methyltransferase